jgi:hypothetical protein
VADILILNALAPVAQICGQQVLKLEQFIKASF